MVRIIPSRFRYPMFFVGIAMMSLAGFMEKYVKVGREFTIIIVALGFAIFVASVAIP